MPKKRVVDIDGLLKDKYLAEALKKTNKELFLKALAEQLLTKISEDNLKQILTEVIVKSQEILVPVSIFNSKLGSLETNCRYLKDNLNLNFKQISLLINRNERTVWCSYSNSLKKFKQRLVVEDSKFSFPLGIISSRKLSTLESIIYYLRENFGLSYVELASILKRDQRNIWTIYNKARKKYVK